MSLFLFILVAEGLSCPMREASAKGEFSGFSVGEECVVEMLQFANDKLSIGQSNWRKMWAIKAVLSGLQVVSGLRVNFLKRRLIGINVSDHFIGAATNFLSSKIEESSFTFLGMPIGCNPRRNVMGNPLISKLKACFENWEGVFKFRRENHYVKVGLT